MQKSKHPVSQFVIAILLVGISFTAQSAQIRVSQESVAGAGDFDANVLGFIDSFDATSMTIANFYQYGTPNGASYNGELNGGPIPLSSTTRSFFVEASDGLHYVVVHDNPNDGAGGSTRMTSILAGGAGGSAGFSVEDDPSEGTTVTDIGGDRRFDANHNWAPCCTDGYAIGDLGSSFLLLSAFDALPTGIGFWQATGDTLASIALALDPNRQVRFDLAPVPVPAAVWLFGTALLGFIGLSRNTRV